MKINLFIYSLLLTSFSVQGQVSLPEAGIKMELPNKKWELTENSKADGKTIYIFKRKHLKQDGLKVIPAIMVIVEDVPAATDVILFSVEKRISLPVEVQEVIVPSQRSEKLQLQNAIGYQGTYYDALQLEHTVYLVHVVHQGKGIQIILDTTSGLFHKLDKEFTTTLNSLQLIF